tara:strand:+ start:694 stop:828 length:135 start_codon:yes stop_codon:yes gene_type:complete
MMHFPCYVDRLKRDKFTDTRATNKIKENKKIKEKKERKMAAVEE